MGLVLPRSLDLFSKVLHSGFKIVVVLDVHLAQLLDHAVCVVLEKLESLDFPLEWICHLSSHVYILKYKLDNLAIEVYQLVKDVRSQIPSGR